MTQRTWCLVGGQSEQQALAPKDTIQNFQFCSVEERTYSSNMLRIWSKRWRVMGTPVAGSCSWHRLWGTSSAMGLCSGGWEPWGCPMAPHSGWAGHGPLPTWLCSMSTCCSSIQCCFLSIVPPP